MLRRGLKRDAKVAYLSATPRHVRYAFHRDISENCNRSPLDLISVSSPQPVPGVVCPTKNSRGSTHEPVSNDPTNQWVEPGRSYRQSRHQNLMLTYHLQYRNKVFSLHSVRFLVLWKRQRTLIWPVQMQAKLLHYFGKRNEQNSEISRSHLAARQYPIPK